MSEMQRPNVATALILIHAAVTRGLAVSIEYSRTFADDGLPDDSTRAGFAAYVQALISFTHGHHKTEDDLAFPYFQELIPDMPYDQLTVEHHQMEGLLEEIEPIPERLRSIDDPSQDLNWLNRVLTGFSEIWGPHILIEESYFTVEAANRLMSTQEQIDLSRQLAEHSQKHSGPDYLVVPFQLFNLSPGGRAYMKAAMPPVVTKELVPVVWKDRWAPMEPFLLV